MKWTPRRRTAAIIAGALCLGYLFCLPRDLFRGTSYSTVVNSAEGELLGARTAADGQWRFPPADTIPEKYKTCLIQFEDRHFRWHAGVDPIAMIRAGWQNISSGHVVSGGSTISMQVIRMSRGKDRTIWQKMVEMVLATRLELRYSKSKILALYASHAPFGGNVVGIRAASWRYFGHPCEELSWSEAATLAVLPNSPSLMHPGKNRDLLMEKRNRLLGRLLEKGVLDTLTYELSCEEPLPDKPLPLPGLAYHLVERAQYDMPGREINSTISYGLQRSLESMTDRWQRELSTQGVNDLCAVVIDVHSGKTVAYVGNAGLETSRYGSKVDIAGSPRSTGSILKPLLYAAAIQEGEILPHTILPDVPVNINGFSPQNFDMQFSGAVPADEALARSLNVPFVQLLRNHGVPRFMQELQRLGMSTLDRSADNYGLSLILGGAEGKLDELTGIYACLVRYYLYGEDRPDACWPAAATLPSNPLEDKLALEYTFDAMKELTRPDGSDWKMLSSAQAVAWKTGTSFGYRDAWSIGVTPDYAVGVWAGNADGSPAAGLTGARTAGPVMFDIFSMLPRESNGWPQVNCDGIEVEICHHSGMLAGQFCNRIDTLYLPRTAVRTSACPYHQAVRISADGRYRTEGPAPGSHMENLFLLPPSMEWFYRQNHPEYVPLPPLLPGSTSSGMVNPMQFIYPEAGSVLYLPVQLDGTPGEAVFHLAHSESDATVFWYLDTSYMGSTKDVHQFAMHPDPGFHNVTATDNSGNSVSVFFSVSEP